MRELNEQKIYEFENFRLEADHLLLFYDNKQLPLTPKVVETLLALVERHGEVISKDELIKRVWPDTVVEDSNLSQNLYLLRKTLAANSEGRHFIETLRRRGYRFNGKLKFIRRPLNDSDIAVPRTIERSDNIYSVVDWRRDPGVNAGQGKSQKRPEWKWPLTAAVAVISLGAIALASLYFRPGVQQANSVPFRENDFTRLTSSGRTKRAAISPDGKYFAHITEDADGSSLWIRQISGTSDLRIAGPAVSEFVWTAFAPDGNSVYYLSLDRDKGDTELLRVPALGGALVKAANDTGPVDFSPDGKSIAFIRMNQDESRLVIAAKDGSNERVITSRRQPEQLEMIWKAPVWSPDGKTLACPARLVDGTGRFQTIIAVNAEDGSTRNITEKRWQSVGQPQWVPGGLLITGSESEAGPLQIWHISLPDGTATRITHDLNDYYNLTLTADRSRLMAVQGHELSSFWIDNFDGQATGSRQIASEVGPLEDVAWMPNSRIAYISNATGLSEVWSMNVDGSDKRQITTGASAGRGLSVSHDGSRIVFSSTRSGVPNIWSINSNGSDLTQLTDTNDNFFPQFTPDDRSIIFQRGETEPKLWTMPADGGEPRQLSEQQALRPAISRDGKQVAFSYLDAQIERSRWSIGLLSVDGGSRLKRFDFPSTVEQRYVHWTPDGRSIAFPNIVAGGSSIWIQPADGGAPRQLTEPGALNIRAFDWSADGKWLAVIRCEETRDVVLMGSPLPK